MTVMSRLGAALLLVASVGSCAAEPPAPPPGPTRALVVWVDSLCATITSLDQMRTSSAGDLEKIAKPPAGGGYLDTPDRLADSYLRSISSTVERTASAFATGPKAGIAAADQLRASYATTVGGIRPEVERLSDFFAVNNLSAEQKVANTRRVGELVASLQTPQPDLSAVLAAEPALAEAHELAPRCGPDPAEGGVTVTASGTTRGPLPVAVDGTNVGACADGTCQILVTGPVDVVVRGVRLDVTFVDGAVTLTQTGSGGSVSESTVGGVGGTILLGSAGGPSLEISIVALNADGAVLYFTAA